MYEPTEETHYEAYAKVIKALQGRSITIRSVSLAECEKLARMALDADSAEEVPAALIEHTRPLRPEYFETSSSRIGKGQEIMDVGDVVKIRFRLDGHPNQE
jgi:phosphoenolpyruvate-protein kinase (PTS system EI component)